MSEEREITVRSCEDLAVGTPIEAHRDGRLTHSGTVTEIAEHFGVFSIADNLSESRRLLDLISYDITIRKDSLPADSEASTNGKTAHRRAERGKQASS